MIDFFLGVLLTALVLGLLWLRDLRKERDAWDRIKALMDDLS